MSDPLTIDKTVFLGWSAGRSNPRPWLSFPVPHLMVNAYDFKNRRRRCDPFATHYSFTDEVFCDSGGYQLLKSDVNVSPSDVISVQERLGARLNAALDHPLDVATHLKYFQSYVAHRASCPHFSVVPVIPHDLPKRAIDRMAKLYPDPPMIAIGKVVPSLFPLRNCGDLRIVIANVLYIRSRFPGSRTHILGVGGITSAAFLLLVADSIDTSSWLHDARYGKIRRAGGGFVQVNRPRSVAGFLESETACGCPVCQADHRKHFSRHRLRSFQSRALHNAWTVLQEVDLLNKFARSGKYLCELERRIRKSPWHRNLLPAVDHIVTLISRPLSASS